MDSLYELVGQIAGLTLHVVCCIYAIKSLDAARDGDEKNSRYFTIMFFLAMIAARVL